MEIGQYIVDLLRGQDEVNVPGLGTFTKIRVAGYFDQSTNVFYPPSYKISFKREETKDSSLIQYLISKENLSQSIAEEQLKDFISDILNVLQDGNSFEIKELGSFYKKDDALSFEPLESEGNALKLSPIQELNKNNSISNEKEEISTLKVEKDNLENANDSLEESEPAENLEEEYQENPKNRSWLKIFIGFIVFLLVLLGLFFLNHDFNTFIKNKSIGLFNSAGNTQEESTILLDSTKINADSLNLAIDSASIIADSIRNSQDSNLTTGSDTLTSTLKSNVITYEIISAAFARKSEADTYMIELSKKGIQSKIVENMPGKMLKISLGTFLDEESAKVELRRIHKEVNKEAWIAQVKPIK